MQYDRTVLASVILVDGHDVLGGGLQLYPSLNQPLLLFFLLDFLHLLLLILADPPNGNPIRSSPFPGSFRAPSLTAMRRRSFHSTSVASSSSPHLDPPANPHPRQTLDRIRILWHRIRALLEVLLALLKISIATTEVQLKGRYQGHKDGINDARSM